MTLVDLPSNDWNQVAAAFFGPGAIGCAEAVLPCMVPKSFYAGEVAPPATLHIGVSIDALQWLSHTPPVSLKDGMMYHDGGMSLLPAMQCLSTPASFLESLSLSRMSPVSAKTAHPLLGKSRARAESDDCCSSHWTFSV